MSSFALRLGNPLNSFIGQEIKYTFSTPHPAFNLIRKHFLSSGLFAVSLFHFSHMGMQGLDLLPLVLHPICHITSSYEGERIRESGVHHMVVRMKLHT